MAEQQSSSRPGAGLGLFDSAKALLATLIGIVHNRLELLSTELQEEIGRVALMLLWGAVGLFFAFLAITFLALLILIAFWDDHRMLVAALLAASFAALALVAGFAAETDRGQTPPVRRQPERAGEGPRRAQIPAMNTHIRELAARREALVAEAELDRAQAAHVGAEIRAALGFVDRGVAFLRDLTRKPLVVGVAVAALTLLIAKPRQAVKLIGYGLTAYSVFQRARRLLSTTNPD